MGKFKPFIFGAALGAGVAVCALQFHVVQSHDGFRVIPRTPQASLGLSYADVRDWDASRWADRPELVRALVAHGSTDLVAGSVAEAAIDGISEENSTLDQLRSFLNESAANPGATGDPAAPGGFLEIPDNVGTGDTLDELFTLPFPRDARNESPGSGLAREEPAKNTTIARRQLPDINEVLGSGGNFSPGSDASANTAASPNNAASPNSVTPTNAVTSAGTVDRGSFGSVVPATSAANETELLEEALFGDDSAASIMDDEDDGFGVFEDITSTLENRAEQALNRARSGFQQEAGRAVTESADSVSRYVRESVGESFSDSVSGMFTETPSSGTPAAGGKAADGQLPAAIKALRDGFDPFVK